MCPVCGDLASAYLHYGARVCYNCRGFFRRCVLKAAKGKTIFTCPFKCGKCTSCRYENCLLVGMRPLWVELETTITKRKPSERLLPRRPRNLMEKFTRDEYQLLNSLFDCFCKIQAHEWLNFHKENPMIFLELWSGILDGRNLPYDVVEAIGHTTKRASLRVVNTVMGKEHESLNVNQDQLKSCIDHRISSEDFRILVNHNIPLVSGYDIASATNTENHQISQYFHQHYWRQLELCSHVDPSIQNLRMMLEEKVCLNYRAEPSVCTNWCRDTLKNSYLRYDQVYDSPWASTVEIEDHHKSITGKIHKWINDNVKESTMEEMIIVHTLLEFIIFFSTDFVDGLKDPTIIQRQQQVFCHLMYKYLKARHGSAKAWIKFGGAVMICSYIRELRDIETRRLRV